MYGILYFRFRYVWIKVPDHVEQSALEEGRPYWSPTLVGCAIAINKTYFNSIGAFDPDQRIWGGENLELAFRTWLCGGTVVTLPCSRVGHAFRPLPYSADSGWQLAWQKNLMRIADTWMGEHFKKYFYYSTRVYEQRRVNYTEEEVASLNKRLQLKKKLKCKTFDWYLSNIIPEMPIPPRDAFYHGELTNYKSHACWEVLDDGYLSITYECYDHKIITDNIFTITSKGLLTYKDKCVKFQYPKPHLKVELCPENPSQEYGLWSMNFLGNMRWGQIQVTRREEDGTHRTWCIMQVTGAVEPHAWTQMPHAAECDESNNFQVWAFHYRFDLHV